MNGLSCLVITEFYDRMASDFMAKLRALVVCFSGCFESFHTVEFLLTYPFSSLPEL